jgi:hypothetical protein
MSRAEEFNKSFERPAAKYLEWASDDKQLKYYDHDTKENVLVAIPIKFIVLMERHTVKGWHDDSESGIWSNEVEDLNSEELSVKAFKGGAVAKGLYKNIKDIVQRAGGHYCKSIYIMTDIGEIWNISLKGSAVFAWGEFVKKDRNRLIGELVEINDAEAMKKGKVSYSVPVFGFGGKIKAAVSKKADEAYDKLIESLSQRAQALAKQVDDTDDTDQEEDKTEPENTDMPDEAEVNF